MRTIILSRNGVVSFIGYFVFIINLASILQFHCPVMANFCQGGTSLSKITRSIMAKRVNDMQTDAFGFFAACHCLPLKATFQVISLCFPSARVAQVSTLSYLSNLLAGSALPASENQCARTELSPVALFWRSPDSLLVS
jgi:hypothetical protein